MALPRIKEATSESSQGRAGEARGIREKELLSVLLGDELPSKMLPVTLGDEGARAGGQARCPGHTHTYPLIQAGPRPERSSLRPSRNPLPQKDADE